MKKFSIENIKITKSDRLIQTDVPRNFEEGINLICGKNEAGKSSLMYFIRNGFFRGKGLDTGTINFKITSDDGTKHYRTEIKDNRQTDMRCRVFDENGNAVSYDFIKDTINQKYFEQGFTIDLDDLMNIHNKNTEILVNTIKDPSGEQLSAIVEKIRLEAKKILGDNNRLTSDTANILKNLAQENKNINELSNLETRYNDAIQEIKELNDELENIYKNEELFETLEKIQDLEKKSDEIKEQQAMILAEYNDNLFNNQEIYNKIIQNAGKWDANRIIINKNDEKIEQLSTKTDLEINRLKNEFAINPNNEDIQNFVIDYNVLLKIKDLNEKKENLERELIGIKKSIENIGENLLRLKHENLPVDTDIQSEEDFEKLKDLSAFINEHLTRFNYLQNKINDFDKSKKINAGGIFTSRNLFILFLLLFVMTVTIAFLCFYNHVPEAGIFAVIMAVFIFLGLIAMKISSYTDSQTAEMKKTQELRENTLNLLKARVKEYYKEIDNIESSYLPLKIENIKTEIQNKIQNYTRILDLRAKNAADTAYNNDKLSIEQKKSDEIQNQMLNIDKEIQSLIDSCNNDIKIDKNVYLEATDIIKNLKEDIAENTQLKTDTDGMRKENEQIICDFNSFVSEMQLRLPFNENYAENIQRLKAFNETNIGLKNNIDILNSQINTLQQQIQKLEDKKTSLENIINNRISADELVELKHEKLNKRKEAEFQKRDLEGFEGLNDLKIKKEILLDEYRKKIYTLTKNKMILDVIQKAKDGFNKVQPDLKQAQKFLKIITDGKYSIINLDLKEIRNEDGTLAVKWDNLSRGTQEQVYFALRLGYASNYTKDRITLSPNGKADLPLIIDDAFVNFDEERTRQCIRCLIEFSKTNQILFFTCHNTSMQKHFSELCAEAGVEVNVINI